MQLTQVDAAKREPRAERTATIGKMKSSICINIDDSLTTVAVPTTAGCIGASGGARTNDHDQSYLVSPTSAAIDGNVVAENISLNERCGSMLA